jgi:hypothetical protein
VTLADYFSPARRKREQKVDLDQNWKPLGDYVVAAIRSILSDRGIDSVTVISRANAIKAADLSDSTWERLATCRLSLGYPRIARAIASLISRRG